jgi:Major Facilitator Superfamily
LGSLLPIFVLQYAGLDPKILNGGIPTGLPAGGIPTGVIPSGVIPTGSIPAGFTGFPSGAIPSGVSTGAFPTSTAPLVRRIIEVSVRSVNPNPLSSLADIPGAPPLWRVNLLSSLPLLIVGLSNYILVPASIIFGRRPVLILCGALAWTCAIWAGRSQSLNSHLAARCVQALGAGAVESLIPLVVTDMTFINQRNRGIGIVWASQVSSSLSIRV